MTIIKPKNNQINILFIDQNVYKSLKMDGAQIVSIHHRTIHLLFKNTIITLGYDIGIQKHHIVIDTKIDDFRNHVFEHGKVTIDENKMQIGTIIFNIPKQTIKITKPYVSVFEISIQHQSLIQELIQSIKTNHNYNMWSFDSKDPIAKKTFEKIALFSKNPNVSDNAQELLGLGVGLTPLGDDILCGFILGRQIINKHIPWLSLLMHLSYHKTNQFSHQMIRDTADKYYPMQWIKFIEGFFGEFNTSADQMLGIGASSGAAVLTGFIIALQKEVKYEGL
jgi:hypothetical protein